MPVALHGAIKSERARRCERRRLHAHLALRRRAEARAIRRIGGDVLEPEPSSTPGPSKIMLF
jgi:hypothetical protein